MLNHIWLDTYITNEIINTTHPNTVWLECSCRYHHLADHRGHWANQHLDQCCLASQIRVGIMRMGGMVMKINWLISQLGGSSVIHWINKLTSTTSHQHCGSSAQAGMAAIIYSLLKITQHISCIGEYSKLTSAAWQHHSLEIVHFKAFFGSNHLIHHVIN